MATKIWNGAAADNTYTTAGNWVGGAAPGNNDDVIFPAMTQAAGTDVDGSDQSGTTLNSFTVMAGCGCNLGSSGTRLYISVGGAATNAFNFAGSGTCYIGFTGSVTANVTSCAGSGGEGTFGLNLTAADNTELNVSTESGCSLGIAGLAGETATFTTIRISGAGETTIGSGVTCTTLWMSGNPTVYAYPNITTIYRGGGTLYKESGTLTTLYSSESGSCVYNSTGTLTTAYVYNSRGLDLSQDLRPKTITTCIAYTPDAIYCPNGSGVSQVVTFTNGISYYGCGLEGLPKHVKVTFSAVA